MDLFKPGVDGDDILKPSLFELIAQEQLRDLLQPALKYVLSVFAQRNPRYLLRLVNMHEEFYALLMLIIERHYLKLHDASFAEHFYGLKRRRHPIINTPRADSIAPSIEARLRSRERRLSLLFLIGIPYLRAKAHDMYERFGGGVGRETRSRRTNNLRETIRFYYGRAYPLVNLLFELWMLLFNLGYTFGNTSFYRPWLKWMRVDIRRMDASDMMAQTRALTPRRASSKLSMISLLRYSGDIVLASLRYTLPLAIFSLRFLEWLYSPSSPAQALMKPDEGVPIPPPRMLLPHPKGLQIDRANYGQCPICRNSIVNPTALPSGYVFCYRCAYEEVENHRRCPVTLLPADIQQLRKVLL